LQATCQRLKDRLKTGLIPLADEPRASAVIARACGSVADVEATYLVILIVTFLAIAAFAGYVLLKLFAGQR
jgi:hypothetical protein